MQVTAASEWVRIVEAFGGGLRGTVVVVGAGAPDVAEALRRAGGSHLAVETERLAVLSNAALETEPAALSDLPAETADVVLLRRAWADRPALSMMLRRAHRAIRSGGRVVAADVDVDRLMASSSIRYPSRVQYVLAGGRADPPRSLHMALSIETGRAGFKGVHGWEVDEERAVHRDARAYWEAIREEGWPVFRELPADEIDRLLERAAPELRRVIPIGEVVDRYPWFVVTGTKP